MLKVAIASVPVLAMATAVLGEVSSMEAESRVLVKRYVKDYGIIHKIEMDSEGLFAGEGVPERYVLSTGEKRRRANLTLQSIADDLSLRAHYRELTYWASSCANPQKPGAPVEDLRAPVAGDGVIIYFEKYEGGATALVVCFAGKECWLPEVGMEGRPDWFVKDAKRFAGIEVDSEDEDAKITPKVLVKRYISDYGLAVKIWWYSPTYELSTGEKRYSIYLYLMSLKKDPSGHACVKYSANTFWGLSVKEAPIPDTADEVIVYSEVYDTREEAYVVGFADEKYKLPEVGME